MSWQRRKMGILLGMLLPALTLGVAGSVFGEDRRIAKCGGSYQDNVVLASFEMGAAKDIWDVLPAMGISPELAQDSRPAFVVVFADGYERQVVAGNPAAGDVSARLDGVVCVVSADGHLILYSNVSKAGFRTPD